MSTHKAPQFLRQVLLLGELTLAVAHATDFHHDATGNLTNIQASVAVRPSLPPPSPPMQVALGRSLCLTVPVQNAGAASYQWFRNGIAIVGATNGVLYLPAMTLADAGVYSLVVSNAFGISSYTNQDVGAGNHDRVAEVSFRPEFGQFSSTNGLALTGSTVLTNQQLRLTPAIANQVGSAWFARPVFCRNGFSTRFQFRITPVPGIRPAEGLSFCLQGSGTSLLADESGWTSVLLDASGHGYNGQLQGTSIRWSPLGPSSVAGPGLNYAMQFNGTNDYVDLGAGVVVGSQFTEEAWIFPVPADTGFHGILGNSPPPLAQIAQRAPSLWIYERTKLHGGYGDGTNWRAWATGDVLVTNDWNHVAATFDGTDYRVYVNGNLVLSNNLPGTPLPTPVRFLGKVENFFPGRLDEVRLWNRARSQAEIVSTMNARLTGSEPGLLAYWNFNEPRSAAVKFDTYQNTGEISTNFLGIWTPNQPGYEADLSRSGVTLSDGQPHTVAMTHDGLSANVWLDGQWIIQNAPMPLDAVLDESGRAWVGFGARCGGFYETHEILNWSFAGNSELSLTGSATPVASDPSVAIVMNPVSQAVPVGSTAWLTARAVSGFDRWLFHPAPGVVPPVDPRIADGDLRYQWRLNGVDLSGQTNATLLLTNVQPAQAGVYSVAVFNHAGTAWENQVGSATNTLAAWSSIATLFNTGVDSNGVPLADNAVDPHYWLVVNPDSSSTNAVVEDSTASPIVAGPWLANTATSKWIGPRLNTVSAASGTYVYRSSFDLTGVDLTMFRVLGRWSSDNKGTGLAFNGIPSPQFNDAEFAAYSPFSFSSGLVPGLNTIDFSVTNAGSGYTGLRVEMMGATLVTNSLFTGDSDSDGLPDTYELAAFGNLWQDATGDFDGDGVSNGDELAEGTNPADPTSLRPRLTVNLFGGYALRTPSQSSFDKGTVVTLTVVPNSGVVFLGWTGDLSGKETTVSFAITSNMVVNGSFGFPYNWTGWPVPGVVQAEDFDEGSEGSAYHDEDASNNGGEYRQTGVDIFANSTGGYRLGVSRVGEWLNYTINVASNGYYRAVLRAASGSAGGVGRLDFIGGSQSNVIAVPATGGWENWTNSTSKLIRLDAGLQVMRFTYDAVSFDLDSIEIVPVPNTPSFAGLLSWWPGEGNAQDMAGTNHGLAQGGLDFLPGQVGDGFSFNGTNARIAASTAPLTNVTDNFTIAFWAWPQGQRASTAEQNAGVTGLSGQRYAVGPEIVTVPNMAGAGVSVGTNGVSVFEHAGGYLPSLLVYDTPLRGWTHIAVVYQDRQPTLFINGDAVRTGQRSTRTVFPSKLFGDTASGYGPYAGRLDELMIYSRAVTNSEVTALYLRGLVEMSSAPLFVTQPQNLQVFVGAPASLRAAATAPTRIAYQWVRNGAVVAGSTNTELAIPAVQFADAGGYQLAATSAGGSVTSVVATLKVVHPIPGLFGTGVAENGSLLTDGAVDPHYRLVGSADASYPGPAAVVVNDAWPIAPAGPWLANGPNSKWIAPRREQNIGNSPGFYTYRMTFVLSNLNPAKARLAGQWAVDDRGAQVRLNGSITGFTNGNGFASFTTFSITNGFVTGTNTLDFVVENGPSSPNPTGLRAELQGWVEANDISVPVHVALRPGTAPGALDLILGSTAGGLCRIETSTNLVNWVPWPSNLLFGAGGMSVRLSTTNAPSGFYRAVALP